MAACALHDESGFRASNLDLEAWFQGPEASDGWLPGECEWPLASEGLIAGQARIGYSSRMLIALDGSHPLCASVR